MHVIVNVNVMIENVIQIKSRIKKNVDVSVKIQQNIVYAKKIMLGILTYVLVRLMNVEKIMLI